MTFRKVHRWHRSTAPGAAGGPALAKVVFQGDFAIDRSSHSSQHAHGQGFCEVSWQKP